MVEATHATPSVLLEIVPALVTSPPTATNVPPPYARALKFWLVLLFVVELVHGEDRLAVVEYADVVELPDTATHLADPSVIVTVGVEVYPYPVLLSVSALTP